MDRQNFNVTEGSNLWIECTATGFPAPTVEWKNLGNNNRFRPSNSSKSPTGDGNVTRVTVTLLIRAMRVDTGMYRCSASNTINTVTNDFTITVQCKWCVLNCRGKPCNLYTYVSFHVIINVIHVFIN